MTNTKSECNNSSNVDLNASIIYAGSLLINPTVSEINAVCRFIVTRLIVVESVVKSSSFSSCLSPVRKLNKVVFPAEVYPAREIILKPRRCLPRLCNSRCLVTFTHHLLQALLFL